MTTAPSALILALASLTLYVYSSAQAAALLRPYAIPRAVDRLSALIPATRGRRASHAGTLPAVTFWALVCLVSEGIVLAALTVRVEEFDIGARVVLSLEVVMAVLWTAYLRWGSSANERTKS